MANVTPTNPGVYTDQIIRIETTDVVLGGETGVANAQAKQIVGSLQYLKNERDTMNGKVNTAGTDIDSLELLVAKTTGGNAKSAIFATGSAVLAPDKQGVLYYANSFNVILPSVAQITASGSYNTDGGVFIINCNAGASDEIFTLSRSAGNLIYKGLNVASINMRLGEVYLCYMTISEIMVVKFVHEDRLTPVGTTILWPHTIKPSESTGWIPCDGRNNLSKAKYPELFAIVGTQYGAGADGNSFKIITSSGYLIRAK